MTRFKSLLAVVVATAIVALAPAANAQNMHIVGAGSSAQFLGTMIGISTMVQNNLSAGQCQFHWTKKSAINAHDNRDTLNRILDETNNVGIVWEAQCGSGGATNITDVWLDAQYDSTLGVRLFSAMQRGTGCNVAPYCQGATVYLSTTAGTGSDNLVFPNNLWADNAADVAIPAGVVNFIGTTSPGTFHVNLGLTDIRPEDALFDTNRAKATLNTTTYAGLGYVGPTAQIGAPIYTDQSGSTSNLTPVGFALSGANDPIYTGIPVPAYTTHPIGAAPIVFVYNNGGTFAHGLADLSTGVNELGTAGGPYNLAHLFDGTTSCDTNNAAFTNGGDGLASPITLFLREPLSGTENTTEWTLFRTTGNTSDTQEKGVINPTRPPYNPLALNCTGNGQRQRRVGNGQVVSAVNSTLHGMGYMFYSFANATSVIGTNVANQPNYQYFTLDGVDPIGLPNGAFGANTAAQQLPYCSGVLCPSSSWTGGISYPNVRNGTYKSWSVYRWLIANTDSDPLGPTVLVNSIRDYIDSTVADFVPFEACPVGDNNPICSGNNNFDGLEVYRSHFTQSAKTCSYTGAPPADECNGSQTPTEALTGGDSLGGGTEQGGDQGGLIIGWDHSTVTTAHQATGACAGLTKVTKTAGRTFGFSATSSAHTTGYPVALETANVSIDGSPVTVSACIAPSASIAYVSGYSGTLSTGHKFAAYIAPTANGALGKKQ